MTTWHLTADHWQAYADGRLTADAEAAIETHVDGCAQCRASATALVPDAAPTWQAVHARIDHPRPTGPLRLVRRLGARDDDLVVLAAADDLRLPWSIAVGGAIASMIVSAQAGALDAFVFWLLAPLVPMLAVAAAFDATDPLRELANTTPASRLRLTLLRTLATLTVALPAVVALGLVVPGLDDVVWRALLPSLGLTGAALVLLTWLPAWGAATATAATWVLTITTAQSTDRLDLLGQGGAQILFALLIAALAAALVATSHRPQTIGVSR